MCSRWRLPEDMIQAEKKTQEGWVAKPSMENLDSMVEAVGDHRMRTMMPKLPVRVAGGW